MADAIEIKLPGSERIWPIRLLDCWAPEPASFAGRAATARAAELLAAAPQLSVFIPAPSDPLKLLGAVTFDRVLGWLYLDGRRTLNDQLVLEGHATRTKDGR